MPVTAEHVSHVYRKGEPGETHALDDVNISIKEGQFVLVAGANGSGKSTFLHCLSGLLRPLKGKVDRDGASSLSIQFPERALFAATVYDDIAFGPLNAGIKKDTVKARVFEASERVGLDKGLLVRHPRTLSHGQRRLVALAGVIAMRPRYLFLDEPTAGMDPASKARVVDALVRLNREGMAIVVASHDLSHFMGICGRILIISHGRITFNGKPEGLVSLEDTANISLPPSLAVARWLKKNGVDAPWDISPEEAAAQLRRIHEGLD